MQFGKSHRSLNLCCVQFSVHSLFGRIVGSNLGVWYLSNIVELQYVRESVQAKPTAEVFECCALSLK